MPKHGGNQGGRPTVYDRAKVEQVFEDMHLGITTTAALKKVGYNWGVWAKWLYTDEYNPTPDDNWFRTNYARAQHACISHRFWEAVDVSNDDSRDQQAYIKYYKGEISEQGTKSDNTAVNRDRLRVETIFKISGRLYPAEFGETIKQELTGKGGADLIPVLNITIAKKGD